jgi:hypothetical protein
MGSQETVTVLSFNNRSKAKEKAGDVDDEENSFFRFAWKGNLRSVVSDISLFLQLVSNAV